MISYEEKTLVILAHIDDEFAISPIIKKITNINPENIKVLFCAERMKDTSSLRKKRRDESIMSLSLLGCKAANISYLNNYFFVDDLKLYNASPVSEESIKRFNYSEIQIQEKNEKAKKNKIFQLIKNKDIKKPK